jgi:hypothetical protein
VPLQVCAARHGQPGLEPIQATLLMKTKKVMLFENMADRKKLTFFFSFRQTQGHRNQKQQQQHQSTVAHKVHSYSYVRLKRREPLPPSSVIGASINNCVTIKNMSPAKKVKM